MFDWITVGFAGWALLAVGIMAGAVLILGFLLGWRDEREARRERDRFLELEQSSPHARHTFAADQAVAERRARVRSLNQSQAKGVNWPRDPAA